MPRKTTKAVFHNWFYSEYIGNYIGKKGSPVPLRIVGSNGHNLHVACVVTYSVNTQTHRSRYAILSNTS